MPEDRGPGEHRDVGGQAVDVRRDHARSRVQPVARDQAGDGHLTVCLGEVRDLCEHANVHASALDVRATARIDRDALVVQDPLRERRLRPVVALDERLQAHRPVEVHERDRAVREGRAALERENRGPRALLRLARVERLREGAKACGRRRNRAPLAARAEHCEGERPVDVVARGDALQLPRERRLQAPRWRRRIGQRAIEPDRRVDVRLVGLGFTVDRGPQRAWIGLHDRLLAQEALRGPGTALGLDLADRASGCARLRRQAGLRPLAQSGLHARGLGVRGRSGDGLGSLGRVC